MLLFACLSDSECGGTLSLDEVIDGRSVKDLLLGKHPPAQPLDPSCCGSCLLSCLSSNSFLILFLLS